MLSPQRHLFYQELQTQLQSFQETALLPEPHSEKIITQLRELQQWFNQALQKLNSLADDTSNSPQELSYLTEIHKQFRLLGLDLSFLQGARQSGTLETRLQRIQERILILMRYCQAILES